MFDRTHYVPLLKTKAGELEALERLWAQQAQGITPLLELFQDLEYDDPAFVSVDRFVKKVKKSWPYERPVFFDAIATEDDPLVNGNNPSLYLFDRLAAAGLSIIPVTDPWRSKSYQDAVKHAASKAGLGICLRIIQDDDETDVDRLDDDISRLLDFLDTEEKDVDLVMDWGEVTTPPSRGLVGVVVGEINNIPRLKAWRTLTFASAAFPESVTRVSSGGRIPRYDWSLWQRTCRHPLLARFPTYGDYACINPVVPDLDFSKIAIAPKIKYTCDADWLVFKGVSHRSAGYTGNNQFRTLARNILSSPDYKGRLFSWGDEYIEDCANGACGPGNNTKWVSVCANHHLAMVVDQIPTFTATLP